MSTRVILNYRKHQLAREIASILLMQQIGLTHRADYEARDKADNLSSSGKPKDLARRQWSHRSPGGILGKTGTALHRQFHKTLLLTRCGLEIVPVRQFYYLPVAAATEGYGVGPSHTYGTPCVACRVENPNVARLRYSPTAGCYLPPDFDGALAEPCGISPGEVFLEGLVRGETTITATIEKNGETLSASTAIRVTDRSDGLVVVSPRWGEKLKQGEKHVIAWRCGGCPASVHMIATIFDDAERVGGVIARLQPANGSYTWDARTVCGKPTPESSSPCEDLRPGYYHISVAEEVDGEGLMRGLFASSAPFQIVSADGASPVPDITADSVKG